MKLDYENLCIVGDIHGEFRELVWTITQKGLENTAFIIAGDFGLGFYKRGYYNGIYERIKNNLSKNRNCILGVRGNHDNPEYFNPESKEFFLDYPEFKALPDYTRLYWGEREILVIGGATSIDKDWRIKEETKNGRKIWWENERPVQDLSKVNFKEDIIISHESPLCLDPVLIRDNEVDLEIYHNILEDRKYLDRILKETRPNNYYFGHYHKSFSGNWGDTLWKGLDINEIIEVQK